MIWILFATLLILLGILTTFRIRIAPPEWQPPFGSSERRRYREV
jgi:hypothetical protein